MYFDKQVIDFNNLKFKQIITDHAKTFENHAKQQLNSKYITGMQSRIKYSIYITETTYITEMHENK